MSDLATRPPPRRKLEAGVAAAAAARAAQAAGEVQAAGGGGPGGEPPAARVRRSHALSLAWLIPLVAALIAGWLAWTTWANQGPTITISFESAEGLEAGATKVRYREVEVGTVERVRLGPNLERILVTARMARDAEPFLTTGTRYWIVRPRVGTGGVSGLGTLVSGAYIEVDPGPGDYAREFTGLEEPPQIRSNVPGREFVLRADRLGSVARGAPLYYRGIEVGQVLGYDLLPTRDALKISVFVRAPYDNLVHRQTRFWNASGVSIGAGADGFRLQLASVQALLVGGIEFETPPVAEEQLAPAGAEFYLFPDAAAADRADYSRGQPYIVEFEGSARGLGRHAPVEVHGIRVGSVDDIRLVYDPGRGQFATRVVVEIAPERIPPIGGGEGQAAPPAAIEQLVDRGLRAQLKTGNLITGDLYVELDFIPGAGPEPMRQAGDLKIIPSVPTQLETIQASAKAVLEKIAALPLPELVQSLTNTAKGLEETLVTPEAKDAVANLSRTLATLDATLAGLNQQSGPLLASLKETSDAAASALRQVQQTAASLAPNSALGGQLRGLLDQLQDAARSIRGLADYLERHPDAIIRGKSGGYR